MVIKKEMGKPDWHDKLFESLSFPTLLLNHEMVVIAVNEKFLDNYGCRQEDLIGKQCNQVLCQAEEPCPRPTCPIYRVLHEKKRTSEILRIPGSDGQDVYEDRVCSPILDEKGDVSYVMVSLRDVTRTKLLELELRKTNDFLQNIISSSVSAIIVADMKGVILLMNESARRLFGYTGQVAVGKSIAKYLYTPGGARSVISKLRSPEYGGVGKLHTTEMTVIHSSGKEIPVEMNASIIYQNGEEIATMGIYTDLRQKIAIEKKLKEAERIKMMQSNKMASLGHLAAGVAHEINNPLTGILIDASLILEELEQSSPMRKQIQDIIVDTNRCKEIVKNLLAYSRQTEFKKEVLNINGVIVQAFSFMREHALLHNITVHKEFSSSMLICEGDNNQLLQVFTNMIINATQAIDGKGTITIRASKNKWEGKIYVEISDTGCGIPKENIPRIFEPFFTTKEEGKGTGLGLSTVRDILEKHGGNIRVQFTSPEGTTFLIELPLVKVDETMLI
jgi:two-component system, NtrC family, sensor kinase